VAITKRFPLGSYIQIDEEIMRVASSTLSIPSVGNFGITVIRGALSTRQVSHDNGSLIRKIKPISIEFRRPSIVRASGHTFEYLGYGPGNYSTGLPQVQSITLTEREEFLVQSQERSGGIVVYTGMNNNGDSFIGNRKTSSSTGEEVTFDNPIPTITGEDPSRLSAVFDEVTVKERLVVEGGNSGTVLSQFDGPVTFNKEVKFTDAVNVRSQLKVSSDTQSTTTANGALVVSGGVGIAKNLNVGGVTTLGITSTTNLTSQQLNVSGITTVDSLNINTTGIGEGDIGSDGGTDGIFGIYNTSNSGTFTFNAKNSGGTNNSILSLSSSSVTVDGDLNVTGDIAAFYVPSDRNWKDNITPIPDALNKVLSISGNTFDWNEKSSQLGKDAGVIAQEIQEVLPEAVIEREDGHLSVSYTKIVPLLIEAVKELSQKIDKLQQKLNDK
jgi:hypothetical protein